MRERSQAAQVLIVDDQTDILSALRLLFKAEQWGVETVNRPAAALEAIRTREFDLVLMDLNYTQDTTSGQEGLDLLAEIAKLDGSLPVVVMTAWGSIEVAVEAMRRGARDFVEKPWENARLLSIARNQIRYRQAARRSELLEAENALHRPAGAPALIAKSAAMQPVLELIARIGPSDANVLITGEHGTGKEVVAQQLHFLSSRAGRPFVAVNAGGLAEGLFETEMFGHVKGAFTSAVAERPGRFELAHTGTLFLDEIANVPLAQQARLLRVLETREVERVGSARARKVDVRVLAATNANIRQDAAEGRFRPDLLFRLNTVEIHLPPLRDREEDIPLLALHFMGKHARAYGRPVSQIHPAAVDVLRNYQWPGNVRELDHTIQRAVLMARGEEIQPQDLGLAGRDRGGEAIDRMTLDDAERYLIRRALERAGGNAEQAADQLGLSRSAMYRRLQKYGLT